MEKQKIFENMWIRTLLWLCAIAAFLLVCYYLKGILISLFLAFTIAYIVDPLLDIIEKRRFLFLKKRVAAGSCNSGTFNRHVVYGGRGGRLHNTKNLAWH